jgi:hypothetical protein
LLVVLVVLVAGVGCSWAMAAMVARVRWLSPSALLVARVVLAVIPGSCRCSAPVVPVATVGRAMPVVVTAALC